MVLSEKKVIFVACCEFVLEIQKLLILTRSDLNFFDSFKGFDSSDLTVFKEVKLFDQLLNTYIHCNI